MIDYLVYICFLAVRGVILLMPEPMARRVGRAMGAGFFLFSKKRKKIVEANLKTAFGASLNDEERLVLSRRIFKQQGEWAVEFLLMGARPLNRAHVEFRGESRKKLSALAGRAAVAVVSHFGNWEFMGRYVASSGFRVSAIARPVRNKYLERFIRKTRESGGLELILKRNAVKEALAAISGNKMVAILADQYAGEKAPLVPFFGVPVSTSPTPALLAIKTGAPLYAFFCAREKDGSYSIYAEGPISVPGGRLREKIAAVMGEYNRLLEEKIRAYPDQWLWFHRRWR